MKSSLIFKKYSEKSDLNKKNFAKYIGIDVKTLRNIENEKNEPSEPTIKKFINRIDISKLEIIFFKSLIKKKNEIEIFKKKMKKDNYEEQNYKTEFEQLKSELKSIKNENFLLKQTSFNNSNFRKDTTMKARIESNIITILKASTELIYNLETCNPEVLKFLIASNMLAFNTNKMEKLIMKLNKFSNSDDDIEIY